MGITLFEKQLEKMNVQDKNKILEQIKKGWLVDLLDDTEIASQLNTNVTAIKNIRNKYHIIRDTNLKLKAKCKREWEEYCHDDSIQLSLETFKMHENEIDSNIYISKLNQYVHNDLLDNNEISKLLNLKIGVITYLKNKYNIYRSKQEIYLKQQKTQNNKSNEEKQQELINRRNAQINRNESDKKLTRQKIKETNLEKYGVTHNWQKPEIREKINENNLKKYGTKNALLSSKAKSTRLKKYGNENYNNREKYKESYSSFSKDKINEIKEKTKITNLEKYGVKHPMQSKEVISKMRKNSIRKWGVSHPFKTDEVKQKSSNTCQDKYGVLWPCMTEQCRNSQGGTISNINKEFAKLLDEYNIEYEMEFPLMNYSYDFKIGNTLVEIDPTYTHNSTKGTYFNGTESKPLDKNYHINKTLLANQFGFRCIHVFDWDDKNKIISMFTPKQKIYAKDCEVVRIDDTHLVNSFEEKYHLQGSCRGQIVCYGLMYNNNLVQIMTFGKPRYNEKYKWELLRLCSHKDYIITGGSKRLWKHFLKDYNGNNIISYCDISKFNGDVYSSLGMKLVSTSKPNIIWSNGSSLKLTNNLLIQRGYDQIFGTNYGKGTSNRELMIENNWLEVYDCGQQSWEYVK